MPPPRGNAPRHNVMVSCSFEGCIAVIDMKTQAITAYLPPPPLQRWWARVRQVSVQCDVIEQTKLSRSFDWNLTRIFDAVQLRRSNACVR